MNILNQLVHSMEQSNAWIELVIVVAALLISYFVMRFLSARLTLKKKSTSIWIGSRPLVGAMFPLLALVLIYIAQLIADNYIPIFWLRLAVSLLMSLTLIRFVARVLSHTFPGSTGMRLIERVFSWMAWCIAVLHSVNLLPLVLEQLEAIHFPLGKTQLSMLNLIEGLLAVTMMMVAVLWLSSLFEVHFLNRWIKDLSMRKVGMNIARIVLITVGLLLALSLVGVDLTALSVMGGALGVGLGFGMQKIASNYVSGFLVLLERALHIGDSVRVDGFEGRITDIKTRFTVIRASNGRESIVPNETLITQRVENLTDFNRQFPMSVTVVVGMDSHIDQVRSILLDASTQEERVLTTPAPVVQLLEFLPHGLQFALNYYIAEQAGQANVRSNINLAILHSLRSAGIALPVPQQEVRLLPVQQVADT